MGRKMGMSFRVFAFYSGFAWASFQKASCTSRAPKRRPYLEVTTEFAILTS